MKPGMEPMKHQRNRPRRMLDATDNSRRRKQRADLWKEQKRAQKRQMRGW